MPLMRLDRFLAENSIGTRSQVRELIKKGLITVNDIVVKKADIKVDTLADAVSYNGNVINYQKYHYYILNKPAGYVTATTDNREKTVMELLDVPEIKKLFPVGRLDKDTEGLLLITDDGELAHRLLSPRYHVDKTYYVKCEGIVDKKDIDRLSDGIDIGDDKPTMPAVAELISVDEKNNTSELFLTIREGRFHQVKRMLGAVDKKVTYLERVSMGPLRLDTDIKRGSYRSLSENEIEELKSFSLQA